jgi:hypothetical protein
MQKYKDLQLVVALQSFTIYAFGFADPYKVGDVLARPIEAFPTGKIIDNDGAVCEQAYILQQIEYNTYSISGRVTHLLEDSSEDVQTHIIVTQGNLSLLVRSAKRDRTNFRDSSIETTYYYLDESFQPQHYRHRKPLDLIELFNAYRVEKIHRYHFDQISRDYTIGSEVTFIDIEDFMDEERESDFILQIRCLHTYLGPQGLLTYKPRSRAWS